ncbi:MAG: hypothetical protein ABIK45_13660 [Pseudomonadota bacterium]
MSINPLKFQLDRMRKEGKYYHVVHWIDEYIKTGVTWTNILNELLSWLNQASSMKDFELVATAIKQYGSRKDMDKTAGFRNKCAEAKMIIDDTRFAVCKRSIH